MTTKIYDRHGELAPTIAVTEIRRHPGKFWKLVDIRGAVSISRGGETLAVGLSLDHELRSRGIRVSVIEPAYTRTQFDANLLAPDSALDEYREVRALLDKVLKQVMATADDPAVVAEAVLKAASAEQPNVRYTAGSLAKRLRLLRRFAPAGLLDAGIRKDLRLDAPPASLSHARSAT